MMNFAIPLHILAAAIWVGGMFFAYMVLRPVASQLLQPEQRLPLWSKVFSCFFKWVWAAVITLFITGFWMIHLLGGMGGVSGVGVHVHIMLLIAVLMALLFMHVYFNAFKKLKWAVTEQDWITGGEALNQIRKLIQLNLILGLIQLVIGAGGRYW